MRLETFRAAFGGGIFAVNPLAVAAITPVDPNDPDRGTRIILMVPGGDAASELTTTERLASVLNRLNAALSGGPLGTADHALDVGHSSPDPQPTIP